MYNSVMEIANAVSQTADSLAPVIRLATRQDSREIIQLLETAAFRHLHLDWQLPLDWLGSPGFVISPTPLPPSRLKGSARWVFGQAEKLQACLAVAADPLPAAWVRVAAIHQADVSETLLAEMFARVIPFLRETAVTQLGWLLSGEWPEKWLVQAGFNLYTHITTYYKTDVTIPPKTLNPQLTIRPVQTSDFKNLEQLEEIAFEPLWRYSARTLSLAQRQALSFDVAIFQEQLVGYQLSMQSGSGAHLVRLVVAPHLQGQGVGRGLLTQAFDSYRQHQLSWVTLNTQVDNNSSQNLYRKFGFQPDGQQLPVWHITL